MYSKIGSNIDDDGSYRYQIIDANGEIVYKNEYVYCYVDTMYSFDYTSAKWPIWKNFGKSYKIRQFLPKGLGVVFSLKQIQKYIEIGNEIGFPAKLVNQEKIGETCHIINGYEGEIGFETFTDYVLELELDEYHNFAHFEIGLYFYRYLIEENLFDVTKGFLDCQNLKKSNYLQLFIWQHVIHGPAGHALFLPQFLIFDFKESFISGKGYEKELKEICFYRAPKPEEFIEYLKGVDTKTALGKFTCTLLEQDYLKVENFVTEEDVRELEKIFGQKYKFSIRDERGQKWLLKKFEQLG